MALESPPPTERPLRRDAERNRRRILEAAAEVFADRGLGATLDDIARHAGVGVGTVYRRFPDKEALIDALFDERVQEIRGMAERALELPDPGEALQRFMEQMLEVHAGDRGLRELMLSRKSQEGVCGHTREQIGPLIGLLVERAQAAGAIRTDVCMTDVGLLQVMLFGLIDHTEHLDGEVWRRMLGLVMDCLVPARACPSPLPVEPISEDELESAMVAGATRRR